jgi:hypothetical protein
MHYGTYARHRLNRDGAIVYLADRTANISVCFEARSVSQKGRQRKRTPAGFRPLVSRGILIAAPWFPGKDTYGSWEGQRALKVPTLH